MKKLDLQFKNEEGNTVTISVDNPIEPANPEAVVAAMDTIIEQNVFMSRGGGLVSKQGARIVDRTVTQIELDIE